MRCLKCWNLDTKVIDSRITEDGTSIRRRRECEKCGSRYTTFERMEFVNFLVTKAWGHKEMYDRTKVQRGIMAACNKRNVDTDKIERIINELESEWAGNKKGITSKRIGKDVLQKLKDLDEVAYIRFASIYLNFEGARDFIHFVQREFE